MGGVIVKANRLNELVKNSTAKNEWLRIRYSFYLITASFILIMFSLILTEQDFWLFADGIIHQLIMNSTYLIISIILYNLVSLDMRAIRSLFLLLDESNDEVNIV